MVTIKERDDKFDVVAESGRVLASHGSEEQALAHKSAVEKSGVSEPGGVINEKSYVPYNVYGFNELEALEELRDIRDSTMELFYNYVSLSENIMFSDQIPDTATALGKLSTDFINRMKAIQTKPKESSLVEDEVGDSGFLYVAPNGDRYLPFKNQDGLVMVDHLEYAVENAHVLFPDEANGIAAKARSILEQVRANEPKSIVSNVVSKVKDAVGMSTEPSGITVYKDRGGVYKWVGRYSNKFRDNDGIPEILSSEAHKNFVKLVDEGVVEPPSLIFWHEPNLPVGQSEWLAYDDVGFPVAGGGFLPHVDEEMIEEIKSLPDVRLSHGMPGWSIARDPIDPTIITQYISEEISLLPGWAAANKRTGFYILGDSEERE